MLRAIAGSENGDRPAGPVPDAARCSGGEWGQAPLAPVPAGSPRRGELRLLLAASDELDHDGDGDVEGEGEQARVDGELVAADEQGVDGLDAVGEGDGAAAQDAHGPADDEGAGAEPAEEQAEHDCREGLQDPHAAQQLQIEGELVGTNRMNTRAPTLTTSETSLATLASPWAVTFGLT